MNFKLFREALINCLIQYFEADFLWKVSLKILNSGIILKTFTHAYGKCSKILNTFLFLFSNKMVVIKAGINKMIVIIANREDPDQTASTDAV